MRRRYLRLDHKPLFGKGARAPHPKARVLLGEGRRPDTRDRRKSSLTPSVPRNEQFSESVKPNADYCFYYPSVWVVDVAKFSNVCYEINFLWNWLLSVSSMDEINGKAWLNLDMWLHVWQPDKILIMLADRQWEHFFFIKYNNVKEHCDKRPQEKSNPGHRHGEQYSWKLCYRNRPEVV